MDRSRLTRKAAAKSARKTADVARSSRALTLSDENRSSTDLARSLTSARAAGPGAERHVAAVDADVAASHKRGLVARQEQDGVGDVLAGPNPPNWVALAESA